MWHSSLIAGLLLLAFSMLRMPDATLLHLGPLSTRYLLLGHSIVGIQQ